MTNRPAGGARSQRWERTQYDWYIEPRWLVEQVFDEISFGDPKDLIYDPCCGSGNILDVAKSRGHPTIGGDVVDRNPRHRFNRGNILINQTIPTAPPGRSISVVCNPPYSYEADIAEKVIRRVLDRVPLRRAAFILPIAFLCGQERWKFFTTITPSQVLICSQRPTMPPGDKINEMSNPFEGGMQDYCVIVYTGPKHRHRTETRWLKPRVK